MSQDAHIRHELERLFHEWSVRAALVGAGIFLILSPLDYLSVPDQFLPFLGFRVGAALALLGVAALARGAPSPALLRLWVFLGVLVSAAAVEVMVLRSGGDHSPYFPGMLLLAVVALGLLPSGLGLHVLLAAAIQLTHLLPYLVWERVDHPRSFLAQNTFLALTLAATVLIRHFSRTSLVAKIQLARELAEKELWLGQIVDERTEQLMKISSEWRTTVDSTGDMIMLLDEEDQIVKANLATATIAGRLFPQLLGIPVFDLFTPEDLPRARHPLEQMRRTGQRAQVEFHVPALGQWFLMTAEPTREGSSLSRGAVITVRDITEIKVMEQALTESRDDWEETFDSINEGITIHDSTFTVLRANAAARRLLGGGDVVGRKCHELFHGTAEPIGGCPGCAATDSGCATTVNLHEPHLDRYLEVTALPRPGGGIVHVVHDISERRAMLHELTAAAGRLQGILARAPFGIFIVNEAFTVEFANPAILSITGYTREEFVGACLGDFPGCAELGIRDRILAAFRGVPFRFGPAAFHCSKGERLIHGQFTGIPVEEGAATKVLVFVEDLSELKKGEEERMRLGSLLLQAQKMESIGTLASGIAHDFNNILLSVIGLTDAALEQIAEGHAAREDLLTVIGAAERGSDLVKQLLAFSRQQDLQMREVDLAALVLETRKMLSRVLPKTIDIAVRVADPLPKLVADPVQVEQVLMNLAVNARDAMPEGGVLVIEVGSAIILDDDPAHPGIPAGWYSVLKVRDTGVGMPPELRARIFDPFFTTKEPGKGTGLGLASVYGIISQHEGAVRVESEPNKGTTFFVYLPAVGAPPDPELAGACGAGNVPAGNPV
jgi:PAS domain S-box-containing protein